MTGKHLNGRAAAEPYPYTLSSRIRWRISSYSCWVIKPFRSSQWRNLLEIGTSNGYSTIWLAWAAQITGGCVVSIDRLPEKQSMADANLKRAGLRDGVDLIAGMQPRLFLRFPAHLTLCFSMRIDSALPLNYNYFCRSLGRVHY
ncbi:MAG: class I SAM-dependent methyltransferase [Chloroflexota bacterium]